MDGEMPDYLLAKDLILQVLFAASYGVCFFCMAIIFSGSKNIVFLG